MKQPKFTGTSPPPAWYSNPAPHAPWIKALSWEEGRAWALLLLWDFNLRDYSIGNPRARALEMENFLAGRDPPPPLTVEEQRALFKRTGVNLKPVDYTHLGPKSATPARGEAMAPAA